MKCTEDKRHGSGLDRPGIIIQECDKLLTAISEKRILTVWLVRLVLCLFLFDLANAQEVTDRTVATVSNGDKVELITLSDLVWQLALQPNTPVVAPTSEKLNQALQLVINQRLILQEAESLPGVAPNDKEITDGLKSLVTQFSSQAEFQERMIRVGLDTDQLRDIVRQRVEIEKYLDFRFRSFTVVSPAELSDYYNQVWVPRLRRQKPGQIVPTLDEARTVIEKELTESKVESQIDEFLEGARNRAEIIILSPV